jgi:hypothetical protein
MRKIMRLLTAIFVLAVSFSLAGCDRTLSGTERSAVLAFSEPVVDNVFAGWAAGDYAAFARSFDTALRSEVPAEDFASLRQDVDGKLGSYISRRIDRVGRSDEYYVVDYQATFGRAAPVKVTVAFHASDHAIAAIALDSGPVSWSTFE